MFSSVTVPSSTSMPTASARPPSVITLMVSPSAERAITENRTDNGMEMMMMIVERQLPRNSRIIEPTRPAASTASRNTPKMAALTKIDWSPTACTLRPGGRLSLTRGSKDLIPSMTLSVEAEPALRIVMSTARDPLTRTRLVCGGDPSCA